MVAATAGWELLPKLSPFIVVTGTAVDIIVMRLIIRHASYRVVQSLPFPRQDPVQSVAALDGGKLEKVGSACWSACSYFTVMLALRCRLPMDPKVVEGSK